MRCTRSLVFAASLCVLAPAALAGDDKPAPAASFAGVEFLPASTSFAGVLEKAAEQKKPAFLDFSTDT